MDSFDKVRLHNRGLLRLFPGGDDPFRIMTRLVEECGELAEQVHIFEDIGVKRKKHGEPDKKQLAKELMDVLRCTLHLASYYAVEDELHALIEDRLQALRREGWLSDADFGQYSR